MLEINNVSKLYSKKLALDGVSLSLPRGELVGLFGENGAGKTTLMKCILGFVGYKGTITLDGEPITRKNIGRIAFATSEHSFFPDLSPDGHAQFYASHFPKFDRQALRRADGLLRAAPQERRAQALNRTEEPVRGGARAQPGRGLHPDG